MNAREDWLKARTTGIGGSDVAAIRRAFAAVLRDLNLKGTKL